MGRHDLDFLGGLGGDDAHLGVVLVVEVAVVLGDGDVDLAVGLQLHARQFLGFVVALGTPGYVVGVTEGVYVEDVEVGGGEEEVLDELWGMLLDIRVGLTGVDLTEWNMCHGSKNRNEATNHMM